MIDKTYKRVNITPITDTTIHGMPSLLIGLLFFFFGIFTVLISKDIIHFPDSRFNAPRWVIGVLGFYFSLAGLSLIIHGIKGMKLQRRKKMTEQMRPNGHWLLDFKWDKSQAINSNFKKIIKPFYVSVVLAGFFVPFIHIGIYSKDLYKFQRVLFIGFPALFVLIVVSIGFYRIIKYFKFGTSTLRFNAFPFFLGETIGAQLHIPPKIETSGTLDIVLRCIEEKYEGRKYNIINCYQMYSDTLQYKVSNILGCSDVIVPISFKLPSEGKETSLSSRPPVYWVLDIHSDNIGIDYRETFLVPVYSRIKNNEL